MNPAERLLWALERLSAAQRGLLWKRAFALGLTLTQAQVLLHLSKREEERPTPLRPRAPGMAASERSA